MEELRKYENSEIKREPEKKGNRTGCDREETVQQAKVYIFAISATFLEISKLRPRFNHLIYPSKCLNIHL